MNNLVDGSGQDATQQGHRRNQSLIAMADEEGSAMNMDMNMNMNMEEGLQYSQVPWDGIENAEWCRAPVEPRLPYDDCQWDSFVFEFGVHGGLTNALHFVLKGTYVRPVVAYFCDLRVSVSKKRNSSYIIVLLSVELRFDETVKEK